MHPLVSVVIPTYNHEKYIAESIQSVLDQTFKDFELIVVNDGSTDKTDEVIRSFDDNRIKYIYQENEGPSMASNKGILESRGKYVCLLAGDDVFYPEKLETQYKYLAKYNKKAVFSWIDIIDDDGNILEDHNVQQYFNIPNRSRAELFKSFFLKANDLCAVTIMAEKSILMDAGLMHLTSIQMQDFYMWVKLVKKHELFVIEEKLVKYRIRNKSGNLSFNPDNNIRTTFEAYQLYREIFDDVSPDFFRECFSKQLRNPDFEGNEEYELEKAFLYINSSFPFSENSNVFEIIGAELLSKILQNKEFLDVAKSKYNFGLPELYELTKQIDVTNAKKLAQEQSQLQQTQSQLQQTQSQLHQAYNDLDAIKSSKFWKLRQKWFEFRKLLGVTNDQQGFSLRSLIRTIKQKIIAKKQIVLEIEQEEWDKNLPLVSVVIPCHNYGRYVEEAIDSVLEQTFQDFEIIVVDGGSSDGYTTSFLKSLQKVRTTIYYREGHHLVGDNRNFGIEKAQGKYICCLDADDKLKPTYLEKALFLLEAYNYDLVSTSVQCFGNSQETWYPSTFPTLETIIEANPIPTVAVFSRQLWKEANGYHDYGIGKDHVAEDWDLWVRMMALGARVVNISEPLMLYRIHGTHTSLSRHPESMSWDEQGKIIKNFNQKYLTRQAYSCSRNNNRTSYKVVNGSINLTNSYSKQAKKEDKLKILFALPFVITGGADSILLQIAKHLSESNFDVSIMTTIKTDTKFGDNTSRYEKITQEIYHLYNFLDDQSSWKDFIYYYLESRQIDILFIVGSSYFYEILPEIKKYFPRIKVIDQLFNEYGHINNNRKYSKFIDMNILASQIIQDVLQQKYQEIEEKTRVITHGVDTQKEFNPININCQGTNGIIPKNKFIVSYMGRFAEEKCPQIFIDIAYKLRDYKNIYFLMLGNGPEYNSSKLKIEKLGLYEKIYSPGFVEDNKPFLKVTDLLIIPSKIEGIPIILMESLSLGIPVIASSIGGIPDIIENNYNGFLCDPNDTDDFVDKIIQVYSDKNLQNQLKSNARNYAETSLDISKMNSEYLDIFISLTNRNTLTN